MASGAAVIVTLTHRIEVDTIQKAVAIRDKCASWLKADPAIKVLASDCGQAAQPFTVYGAELKTGKAFADLVEATTRDAAKSMVESETKVVTLVMSTPLSG